jgi:hypothetical protein
MSPSKKWKLCQVASEHEETLEQRLQLTIYVGPPPFSIIPITKVRKDSYNGNFNRRFVYFFLVFVFSQNNLKYIFGIWGCSNIFEVNFGFFLTN